MGADIKKAIRDVTSETIDLDLRNVNGIPINSIIVGQTTPEFDPAEQKIVACVVIAVGAEAARLHHITSLIWQPDEVTQPARVGEPAEVRQLRSVPNEPEDA